MQNRHWRKKPSETLIKLMEDSVDLKLYLVQEKGPLCLTFQDDNGKKYQISIGNTISCSCGGGKTEHCIHTLFTLNRIFKIAFNNPLILQLQFSDSELNKLLEAKNKKKKVSSSITSSTISKKKTPIPSNTNQMSLVDDAICPICQEDMYTQEGVYYCESGCGHNFHIGCLKVFIKHKKDSDTLVTCPMCRAKWDEEAMEKAISGVMLIKCVKPHKGVNCSNCSRTNIKFERFHCLICDNVDLCVECFATWVHRDKGHNFIMKKNPEEKWVGCHYKEMFEVEDNPNANKKLYSVININLVMYLTSCLSDSKKELANTEPIVNEVNGDNSNINEMQISNISNSNNNDKIQCSICKQVTKTSKAMQFLSMKSLPNCQHQIHVKCLDKALKIISYENHHKFLVVDRNFNKCRICSALIFKGLGSIKTMISEEKENQNVPNNNNSMINKTRTKTKSRSKRQLIAQLMNEKAQEDANNFGFAFSIQKVNFNNDNDIQKFESNLKPKSNYIEKQRIKGIPYRQVQHKVKKVETIVARNKEPNTNVIGNTFQVKKMPIMNSRPARIEHDHKVQLSPLLIDL